MKKFYFLDLFRMFIEHYRQTSDHFEKRKNTTINIYSNKYFKIAEFLNNQGLTKITADKFTITIAKNYLIYLTEKNYKRNTAVRMVQICAQVLEWAAQAEKIKTHNLIHLKLKRLPPERAPYYRPHEILLWENYTSHLSENIKAADMFILQLHTGIDYGDFDELSRDTIEHIEGDRFIVKGRHKNGTLAVIPFSKKAEEILEKYNWKVRLLSNVNYNKTIKIIAAELGLDPTIKSKSGRKLFVMDALNNKGYSIQAASRMAGHKSIRTTETTYGQINKELVSKEFKIKKEQNPNI